MWNVIATLTMLVLVLGTGVPAQAQSQTGERVFDVLSDVLRGGGNQHVRGFVVAVHDADVVVRGGDNRTYTLSTTGIDRRQLGRLQPGQAVKATVKRGSGDTLVASAIESDNGEPRSFRTVSGTVESVSGSRVQFRSSEGFVLPVDLNQIVGSRPTLQRGDPATVTYEQTGQNPITAVWIETSPSFGAASPRTSGTTGSTGGGYERIHGFVQSIGLGTFTLKTDDGRTMMVDVSGARAGDVRPGDLVNVVGRTNGDRFLAEAIQKD